MQTSPITTTPPSPAVLDEHVLRANRALRDAQTQTVGLARCISNLVADSPNATVPGDWRDDYQLHRASEKYAQGVFRQASARARAVAR